MKRCVSAWLALVSAALAVVTAGAARPQYGGTLRVGAVDAAVARDRVLSQVFETLTRVDGDRGLQPLLAQSWDSDARGSRWRVRLRSGVRLHDGSPLEAWHVAAALRVVEPGWKIAIDGDGLVLDLPDPIVDLPWILAQPSHAIAARSATGASIGTGPFGLERQDQSSWSLRANDSYRDGRPFVDAVQIQAGKALAVQLADLEAGRTDLVPVLPNDARRLSQRGLSIVASRPVELVALVFEPHRAGDALQPVRRTLSLALNRSAIADILLQQRATPAFAIVPAWLSGYDRTSRATGLSRAAVAALPMDQRELVVRVDPLDTLARAIADRMAVDASQSGFALKVQAPTGLAPRADARLVRVPLAVTAPDRVLAGALTRLSNRPGDTTQAPAPGSPIDAIYRADAAVVDRAVVIPIVHLSDIYGASERVGSWNAPVVLSSGAWNFADVWLRNAKP